MERSVTARYGAVWNGTKRSNTVRYDGAARYGGTVWHGGTVRYYATVYNNGTVRTGTPESKFSVTRPRTKFIVRYYIR